MSCLDEYYKLSNQNKALIVDNLEVIHLKKGAVLIPELTLSPYLYFIEKGAVKTYYIDEKGNKNVVWFGFEGDICFSISSYINVPYIHETIELFEDSIFYRVKIDYVKSLYNKYLDWSNWGRCFIEFNFAKTVKEMDEHKLLSAKERYKSLIKNKGKVRERASLKDIASYLGVSPVTISRLRKEIKNEASLDL